MPKSSVKRTKQAKTKPGKPTGRKAAPTKSAGRKRASAMTEPSSRLLTDASASPQILTTTGGGNGRAPSDQILDLNVPGLNRNAVNPRERHMALDHVTSFWAAEDITALRRVESTGSFKWVMWRRSSLPPS